MRINREEIQFDNTSYIDPMGRIFYWNGGIYRGFYPNVSSFYRVFLDSSDLQGLVQQGKVVETTIESEMKVEDFDLIVRHRRIPFPNYCFEWSMSMLKDAALLTLEIAMTMCENNIILQDATPYNIFFDFSSPVFIDMGSFTPSGNDYLWAPYQQFCNFFLFPLYLHSSGLSDIAGRLLKDCINGISAQNVAGILGTTTKLMTPGYMKRVFIPELFTGLFRKLHDRKKMTSLSARIGNQVNMKKMRARFFSSLYRDVENIKVPAPASHWSDYYVQTKEDILEEKKSILTRVISELRPDTVLDIGSNVGAFSMLSAESGASVISFDTDHDCVGGLYNLAKKERLNILPLVMNILDPSPDMGWRGVQYRGAKNRFKCDMVLALALIHHLVFTGGQDFSRSIQSIKDFQSRWLIIEYIDKDDPMARLLSRRPGVEYSWYTLDNFMEVLQSHYDNVEILKKLGDTRTLLLAS